MRRIRIGSAAMCCIAALQLTFGGCGGGDAEPQLAADFDYPDTDAYLWRPASLQIRVTGLEGRVPVCTIVAGQLLAGLSLEPVGCAIAGVPMEASRADVTIRLTVPGYRGGVEKTLQIVGRGPSCEYPAWPTLMESGTPVSVQVSSTPGKDWVAAPGESIDYFVASGKLPTGLALDPATGTLSGVITSLGPRVDYDYTIGLTARSATEQYVRGSAPQRVTVAGPLFGYDTPGTYTLGVPISVAPVFTYPTSRAPGDYAFRNFRAARLPLDLEAAGLHVDPDSGVIAGIVKSGRGRLTAVIQADVSVAGQTGLAESVFSIVYDF